MDNGQHEHLLREVLMNLERMGGDLIEKAQWARNHGLCDEPPGTQGYNNKCKFDDGLFICVKQVPGQRGHWNYVVMGHGNEITHDQPPDQIRWKPNDSEIVDYARTITPWVASIIHGQESASRTCGGQPSSLRVYGKPSQRNPFRLILLAMFAGVMILYFVKTTFRNASPKIAIAAMKTDVARTAADERHNKVESKTRKIEVDEVEKKYMLELSRKQAELEEVKKKGIEQMLAFLVEQGETKEAEKLRGLFGAGKIDEAWELVKKRRIEGLKREVEKSIEVFDKLGESKIAAKLKSLLEAGKINDATDLGMQKMKFMIDNRPDPWTRSELSSENRAAIRDKAGVFGVSFATVVAYEMARVRVPTSKILKTMKTYDSLDDSLLRQIDRIKKQVDDRHLRSRLWKLSSAIDDILSEKASGNGK